VQVVPERPGQPRKLIWLVDSLDRLTSFSPAVQHRLGFALYQAQIGQKHESAKTLRGFEETVWQDLTRLKLARRMASKKGDHT
jgi:phage-related protein